MTICGTRLTLFAAFLLLLPYVGATWADNASLAVETANGGKHVFTVELATTREQQATGLMFRRDLAPGHGMLFVYPGTSPVAMWMKNTFIPLDMLFIDTQGRITHIVERTVPESTELIGSKGPVKAVLEVRGGTASRLGIKVGDRVRHPVFP